MPEELFPDISLPTLLTLPAPPDTEESMGTYIRKLHYILGNNQNNLVRALYILGKYRLIVGSSETFADLEASGSGTFFINQDDSTGWFDHPELEEWVPLSGGLGPTLGFSFATYPEPRATGPREPIVAFEQQPQVELGDDVVTRCSGPLGGTHVDQPSDFLWTLEGDIVMGLV